MGLYQSVLRPLMFQLDPKPFQAQLNAAADKEGLKAPRGKVVITVP